MLVRLEIRVEFSLLAWDWNIAPVAHRAVLLSEEDDQGGYERKAEAPEQVAELDFGSEESAWKEVVFVIAIENNWEDKSPDKRRLDAEVGEEGLGDALRGVRV